METKNELLDRLNHAFYSMVGVAEDNLPDRESEDEDLQEWVDETYGTYDEAIKEFEAAMKLLKTE